MSWLNKLKEYAPSIATAVLTGGASLPALAMKAISDATGLEVTNEAQLSKAIDAATPEQLFKMKQADNSFKLRMQELASEMTNAELGDVQNARKTHKESKMPATICITLTAAVIGFACALMVLIIPDGNQRMLDTLFGSVLTAWLGSLTFFTGTTRSSGQKNEALAAKSR
mgnify:FL=1|tara:strand:+ start:598 stop:1107 length:510 start_codon:yes stop_codon:yes gene_type:complete